MPPAKPDSAQGAQPDSAQKFVAIWFGGVIFSFLFLVPYFAAGSKTIAQLCASGELFILAASILCGAIATYVQTHQTAKLDLTLKKIIGIISSLVTVTICYQLHSYAASLPNDQAFRWPLGFVTLLAVISSIGLGFFLVGSAAAAYKGDPPGNIESKSNVW